MSNKIFEANGKQYTYTDYIRYSIANHGGKMEGIPSISTSVLCNPNCARNAAVKGSVCEKCFARNFARLRKTLADKLESNYKFYTTVELTVEDVPFINVALFRFEAFGDLANERQFRNYCTIAKANPRTRFVLWTKNIDVIRKYVKKTLRVSVPCIPNNFDIVASSLMLNQPLKLAENDWFVDAVFTVYDKQTIETENIDINCGGRKCLECRRCYSLNYGQVADIREKLK